MLKKPTPIKLSEVVRTAVSEQLNKQTVSAPSKSTDPVNFPVFEVPVNKKVLIYVPNHVVTDANGCEELKMDKPLIHSIKEGKRYFSYRCITGISATDEKGNIIFDGSCPLCDGTDVPWDLANLKIEHECTQRGLDPNDKDNDQVKSIRSTEFSSRVIKEPTRYYTFPIVVIATENDDGKNPVKDEKGNFVLTPMWYNISEAQYNKRWLPTLEGIEDEPTHPGGRFFTLSFVYDTKGKEATKRDSAQNLNVIAKTIRGADKLKEYLDESTKAWTPEKAQETVISNQLYSLEDMKAIADDLLEGPIAMVALLRASQVNDGVSTTQNGYNLQVPEGRKVLEEGIPDMGDTDEDFE